MTARHDASGWAGTPAARWSVRVLDLDSGEHLVDVDPTQVLETASLAKVFALVEAAACFEDGRLDEDELLDRRTAARIADSGLWHRLAVDVLPAVDLAALVGATSDNWATNVLVGRVGLATIQARVAQLGYERTGLHDVVRDPRGPSDPPTLSTGTAADWVDVLARLVAGRCVSPTVSGRVLDWLRAGMDYSMVAAGLDLDPLVVGDQQGPVRVANKTGSDVGVRADAGVVESASGRLAYACLVNWDRDEPGTLSTVLADMRSLGRMLVPPSTSA